MQILTFDKVDIMIYQLGDLIFTQTNGRDECKSHGLISHNINGYQKSITACIQNLFRRHYHRTLKSFTYRVRFNYKLINLGTRARWVSYYDGKRIL